MKYRFYTKKRMNAHIPFEHHCYINPAGLQGTACLPSEEAYNTCQHLTFFSTDVQNHNLTFYMHTLSRGVAILSQSLVGK